ncbi:toxin-antitoxin system antitoxin subunit [Actinomyces sp. Z5]|uniref:HepT-like ribonuclease domain-containing protein n=1 Tax=Actinomyces sp. Z5 TaxID=2250216 RepID=UPI000DCDE9C1|nr:HepT-like ribonuclease domain-containing protein [Actinomyces sp. Z5]RAX23518.1 toxin-antitoxin system antitoxin subunit [Actinomyces sp. Z5]
MSRSSARRVTDALQAIDRCRRYADALGSEDVDVADMAEDAIERNLQIIGEAVNHLPAEVTDQHPEIAWQQIRGFRNILVNQYFGVDVAVVREVVENYLPPLADVLRRHVVTDEG